MAPVHFLKRASRLRIAVTLKLTCDRGERQGPLSAKKLSEWQACWFV
jgi:hypothetical protein